MLADAMGRGLVPVELLFSRRSGRATRGDELDQSRE